MEKIEFSYSPGGIEPRRFLEFVQGMPKLRVASFQGIDEEECALGRSVSHPDWIAAQSTINQRILRWGGVVDKSGGPASAYKFVFA